MENTVRSYQFLNRDVIKYIAIVAMVLDHIANAFSPQMMEAAPNLQIFFENVGSFTAITMIYFLVEGYHYTHSKKKYITRLLLFAAISQIPFMMAFAHEGILEFEKFNMLVTLSICFGAIYVLENVQNVYLKVILIALAIAVTAFTDWKFMAVIFTVMFYWAKNSKKRLSVALIVALLCDMFLNFSQYLEYLSAIKMIPTLVFIGTIVGPCLGMFLAAICLRFFYNGKRMELGPKGRAFSKWFFYIFYPGHLLILGIIRIVFFA